jgi:hypothetical protein
MLRSFAFEATVAFVFAALISFLIFIAPAGAAALNTCLIKSALGLVSIVLACLMAGATVGFLAIDLLRAGGDDV